MVTQTHSHTQKQHTQTQAHTRSQTYILKMDVFQIGKQEENLSIFILTKFPNISKFNSNFEGNKFIHVFQICQHKTI